ncbi:MAG: molecular chaperone DnaJ [Telluria sp.]
MKSTSLQALHLVPPAAGPVSRARKQFNTLIKKLEAARALLAQWKEALPLVMSKMDSEYNPLVDTQGEHFKQLLVLLDDMHGNKLLGKREREKLSRFVASNALDLLADADDAVLKDLYNRHSGADFDAQEDESKEEIRHMMEMLLGAEFKGDIDVRSPEAMLKAFHAQLAEQDGEAAAPERHQEEPRPKRAADLARERRLAAEAQRVKQSMRDIFRKLASQLHPDRETDDAERQRKTALMQRVNAAYAANDMLGLLELQLEVEQIDQASLANLSEERIKQYNKVLKEQLSEFESEIDGFIGVASVEMDADMFDEVTPASIIRALDSDIAHLRLQIAIIEEDLQSLHDVKMLKAWLKDLPNQPSKQRQQRDDDPFW